MRVTLRYYGALWVLAVVLAASAHAHREHGALSTLHWNAADSLLQITHRLHAADIQTVLGSAVSIDTLEGQARGALYVEQRFELRIARQVMLLETIGAELIGDELFVYQEIALTSEPAAIDIRNRIFAEHFEVARNTLTLEFGGNVISLSFNADSRWQQINLPKSTDEQS